MGCGNSQPKVGAVAVKNPVPSSPPGATKQGSATATELLTAAALKSKRRGNVMAERQEVDHAYVPRNVPKDAHARTLIQTALRDNILFASIGEGEIAEMINAMEPIEYAIGAEVIKQGDKGENFYVVERGRFDIIVNGKKVADFGEGTPNMSFGELALLYNSPRAATVQATTTCKLWSLDRVTFRGVVAKAAHAQHNRLKTTLRRGILEDLTDEQIGKVAAAATVVQFPRDAQIIRKGEAGEVFYIIENGSVVCKNLSGNQSDAVLHAGDYFGERALLLREPRAADVFAQSDVTLVALAREDFEALLGHLRELLERNIGMRLLACVPIMQLLSTAERVSVLEKLTLATYEPGQLIIKQGMPVSAFYIIKEGTIAVRKDGEALTLKELTAGQWFGESEVKSTKPSGANVIAKTQVQLFQLDREVYMATFGQFETRGATSPSRPGAGAGGEEEHKSSGAASSGVAAHIKSEPRARLGIPFRELEQRATLGTGTFGRVKLVYHAATKRTFAMKILQKVQIQQLRQQANIMNERDLMMKIDHPFILKLYDTYKDRDRLYMLLELVQGGELFSRLQNSSTPGRVSVNDARFYGGCVLDAFEHMHARSIVYRDLKPENLLIDSEGYLKVVDFGFAKVVEDRTYTLCGTPEYLAPELVLGRGHGAGVDYWALGVLLYEMVCGYSPFADMATNDQMKICKNILRGTVVYPSLCPPQLKELIALLLEKDLKKRLGCLKGGASDIKRHKFFSTLDFEALVAKTIASPWKPKLKNATDTSNFDQYDEDDHCPVFRDDGTHWDAEF